MTGSIHQSNQFETMKSYRPTYESFPGDEDNEDHLYNLKLILCNFLRLYRKSSRTERNLKP